MGGKGATVGTVGLRAHLDRQLASQRAAVVDTHRTLLMTADAEALRRARVATRRLEATVTVFEQWLHPAGRTRVRRALKARRRLLGDARRPALVSSRLADDLGAGHPVLVDLGRRYHLALVELYDALRTPRQVGLLVDLADGTPRSAKAAAKVDAASVVVAAARDRWRVATEHVARHGLDAPDDVLHDLRKLTRRTRDVIDAGAGAVPAELASAAKPLRRVQRLLGEHQDACEAVAWLSTTSLEGLSSRSLALANHACRHQRRLADEARAAVGPVWDAAVEAMAPLG